MLSFQMQDEKRESKKFIDPALFGSSCLVFLIFLICQLSIPVRAQAQPQVDLTGKNVLVLHAFESNVPIFELTDRGLRAALDAGGVGIRNQFFEYLDLARNPGPEHRRVLVEQMRLRYGHRKLSMIITMYPEALQFAVNEGRTFFPETPILALYLPPGVEQPKTERRIIRHSASLDIIGTFEIALKLVPVAKRVYAVNGAHPLDKRYEALTRRDLKKWESQLEFHYLNHLPLEEILATVSNAPAKSIVFFTGMAADVTGRNFTSREVAGWLGKVSEAPVFGVTEVMLGHGIAGGFLISFEKIGTRAGELVLEILRGAKTTENIPESLDVPFVPMFDWQQLKRWNLSVSALPKGSVVIKRELRFWDYKYYIIGALIFCLAETALIIILIAQRRRKKVAEEGLLRKTEELDKFFNVSLDLLGIANTDGYFLRLNPAAERVLGYTREELMSRRFVDFIHPEDLDRTQKAVSILASQQKVFYFENRYRCKDGTYRWLEWSSVPAGNLIYAAARDVTDRKQAEEELTKSEERLRMLIETMNEGFGVRNENGVWTYVNDQFCCMLGCFPGDIVGRPVTEFLDEANQSILGVEIQNQRERNYSPYEITWTGADGRKVTTIVSPKPIFNPGGQLKEVFAVITDITERKRAEEALRESEERLRDITFSMGDWVWEVDANGVYTYSSLKGLELLGHVIGKTPLDFMPPDEAKRVAPIFSEIVANKAPIKDLENWNIGKNGENLCLLTNGVPILDEEGNLKGYRGVDKDITERKQAEAEVARARAELLHVERSLRLNEMTVSLAHELNQPLAAILSNAQAALRFLKSDKPDLNEIEEILRDIISDDQRAGNVIRSLRSMMKREEREKRPTILNDILSDVIQIFRSEAIFRNVSIETELEGFLPPVFGDKGQLQQVVLNIIMNSAEAMSRTPPEQRKLILRTEGKGHRLWATVRDFGPGIDEGNLERIFQPFFTTKRSGLGMGLAICSSIIKDHRGRIWAENNPDGGATFFIELPVDESGK